MRSHPTYLKSLTARNRLTDARHAIHDLLHVLPADKHHAIIGIYNELCTVQGDLERLLDQPRTSASSNPGRERVHNR